MTRIVQEVPIHGKIEVIDYLDFSAPVLVKSIEKLDFCQEIKLRKQVNLKEYIERIQDSEEGLVEYLGLRKLSW